MFSLLSPFCALRLAVVLVVAFASARLPAHSEEPLPEPRVILVLGDSLAAGSGVSREEAFPALLQQRIDETGRDFKIVNAGVSGDTSAGGLRRLDWVLRNKIDILILELGANDGLRGIPPEATRANLQAIMDRTRSKFPHARVLIAGMKMPPNMGPEYTEAFERIFPDLARANDALLVPFLLEGVGGRPELNLPDRIHPSPDGHRILAGNVWQVLAPLLEPRQLRAAKPNVLFIAIDDLRADLGALGVSHARTPQLDSFAATARLFTHHYAQVPTCGASRCALLRGKYPSSPAHLGNNAIAQTHAQWGDANLPKWFQKHGYGTFALGKVTHYPGGRTGRLWTDGPEELPGSWTRSWIPRTPWNESQKLMHGFANGQPRTAGSPPWEAFDGPDSSYPDAWVADEAIVTLRELASKDPPWFLAVGFLKPHLPFAAPKRWFNIHDPVLIPPLPSAAQDKPSWPSNWHNSGEFRGNYSHSGRDPDTDPEYRRLLRHAYAACISYMDDQVGRLLLALDQLDLADSTIVVIWSDHGFLLGEHAIWGKHCLYEPALRSPLLIRHPAMPFPGQPSAAIVETVDLFPTLTDLCSIPAPSNLDGRSLRPHLNDPSAPSSKPALAFWTADRRSLRTDRWRLIARQARGEPAQVELFDYATDPFETTNHAREQPELVSELLSKLP